MGSVALNFVGGIPFQGLYDVVKVAIHKSRKFKIHLLNLEFTLRCIHSPTLEEIRNNYVRLNLLTDTVIDLKQKVIEGKTRVGELSELSIWNIRIWGNCCNCIGPDYAKELDELDRSLWSLLELLQLEQMRNMTELLCLAREAKDRQDGLEKKQGEVLTGVQELGKKVDELLATLKEQQDARQRIIPNSMQQAPSSSGGGATNLALGVVFRELIDAIAQVKVENMMFKRLLNTFKSTLYCLQPLIEEIAEHGRVVHLPKQEVEKLTIQIENGVHYVLRSKVRKNANYKKYKYTNKILSLDESLQRLFIELKGQVERNVKEAMDSANKIEMAIKKIEAEGLCDVQLPELHSHAVGFDILNMQGLRDVIEETLLDSASVREETEGSSNMPPELPSLADGVDVLNMQGSLDLSTTNIQVVVTETEGIGVVDDSTRNVQETADLLDEERSESEPAPPTVGFDAPDVHETSEELVTLDKQNECGIATAELLSSSPAVGLTSASTTNTKARLKQHTVEAKASEFLYNEELRKRKEIEDTVAREREELEKMKKQRDEIMEEFRAALEQRSQLTLEQRSQLALEQRSQLESQIAESDQLVQSLEQKIISAVDLLQNYKRERDELHVERDNALREAEELRKRQGEASSTQMPQFFNDFSFPEIEEATRNFDPSLKIGEGGYGSIFKGFLRHTEVAIKMLNAHSLQGPSEFQQEVDILSKLRHTNLVTLIGACPEGWTLIYEYLPNGSLEDRLSCKDNTPPLSWQARIRIATELCSVLIFLHSSKPHGVVHGDLKPSNILLDANFVCKLSDFGISRLLSRGQGSSNNTTLCCWTGPKGTFAYMDPEFLSSGELTPKSDVYSFGIILLRLLTGKPALGITKEVQYALDSGKLETLLDPLVGDWPFVQAEQLARLALRCCEMSRKCRADLVSDVWRVLEPMRASCGSLSSFRLGTEEHFQPPSYFICPIFQEVMQDPHVAADGFTYEAEALRGWLDSGHDTSPMTNQKLEHKNLVPNHALRSAIQEWLQHH